MFETCVVLSSFKRSVSEYGSASVIPSALREIPIFRTYIEKGILDPSALKPSFLRVVFEEILKPLEDAQCKSHIRF